jgi:amino acid transporter
MLGKLRLRPDLLLLLSLLLVILLNPVLDHGDWRRLVLGAIMFIPVILSIVRLSEIRVWVWPSVLLMFGTVFFFVTSNIFRSRELIGIHSCFLAAFFAFTAVSLFAYLANCRSIERAHLYTAVSIYLLIGYTWAALYCAWDVFYPGSIQLGSQTTNHQSVLLYFSFVTLSTIGYGDVVPLSGEARMLAVLEGVTGVLYIAVTVGILVSSYKRGAGQHDV